MGVAKALAVRAVLVPQHAALHTAQAVQIQLQEGWFAGEEVSCVTTYGCHAAVAAMHRARLAPRRHEELPRDPTRTA